MPGSGVAEDSLVACGQEWADCDWGGVSQNCTIFAVIPGNYSLIAEGHSSAALSEGAQGIIISWSLSLFLYFIVADRHNDPLGAIERIFPVP